MSHTIVHICNGDGLAGPPKVIYKAEKVNPLWTHGGPTVSFGGKEYPTTYGANSKGGMDEPQFAHWIENNVLPMCVGMTTSPRNQYTLHLDGDDSHIPRTKEQCDNMQVNSPASLHLRASTAFESHVSETHANSAAGCECRTGRTRA